MDIWTFILSGMAFLWPKNMQSRYKDFMLAHYVAIIGESFILSMIMFALKYSKKGRICLKWKQYIIWCFNDINLIKNV